ncbi:hypothetical protein LCGC14_2024450 [marine sediment metagenome]|uniref:Uncharacterized protein n=1 Tax=marine sediment metagenome TaxID=412755 RepID=A0A0F9H9Y1_9ZZZZ
MIKSKQDLLIEINGVQVKYNMLAISAVSLILMLQNKSLPKHMGFRVASSSKGTADLIQLNPQGLQRDFNLNQPLVERQIIWNAGGILMTHYISRIFEDITYFAKTQGKLWKFQKYHAYHFLRILRNWQSHSGILKFTSRDKSILPAKWKDNKYGTKTILITLSDAGTELDADKLPLSSCIIIVDALQDFVKNNF